MLSWFMSDSVTVTSAKENAGAPPPKGLTDVVKSMPVAAPASVAVEGPSDAGGASGVPETPDRTEEEETASPALRRSHRTKRKLNNSIDGESEVIAVRKVVRRQRMLSVRRTPVQGTGPKVLPLP